MDNMVLYYRGIQAGRARIMPDGLFFNVVSELYVASEDILKVYLTSPSGACLSAGVFCPSSEGGHATAEKKISLQTFREAGLSLEGLIGVIVPAGDLPDAFLPGAKATIPEKSLPLPEEIPAAAAAPDDPPKEISSFEKKTPAGWSVCRNPRHYLSDPCFKNLPMDAEILICWKRPFYLIAAPLQIDKPFALFPAFTIITPVALDGRLYGVLAKKENGPLVRMHK